MSKNHQIYFILACTFTIRMLAAVIFYEYTHPIDIGTFGAWANALANHGLSQFYYLDIFTDYPPAYMYVLNIIGHITQNLNIDFGSTTHHLLLKTPAILFDVATVALIYKIALNFKTKQKIALGIALIYALNPAIIMNSAIWGQVDSIHTFLLAISVYLISQRKMLPSLLLFSLSIMVKPQSFMFSPIYLFMFYKFIFGEENTAQFNPKNLTKLVQYGLICISLIAIMALPFVNFANLTGGLLDIPVIRQYIDTFGTYSFVTHNAYNIYALIGLNSHMPASNTAFLGISYNVLGTFLLVVITLFSIFLLRRKNDPGHFFLVGAVLVMSTFVLSTRMHERYNFPALLFLLLAYTCLKDKRLLYIYAGFSIATFINVFDVLMMHLAGFNWPQVDYSSIIFSIPIVAIFAYFIYVVMTIFVGKPKIKINLPALTPKGRDIALCLAIMVFYSTFAFTNLGNTQSPQSHHLAHVGQDIVIDFGQTHHIGRMQYMLGVRDRRHFTLQFSQNGIDWPMEQSHTAYSVFAWGYVDWPYNYNHARFVRIIPQSPQFFMQEMAFRDIHNNLLPITVISPTGHELFDEQHLVPQQPRDFMHSTYFDEIFHPRTAYEFIHQLEVLEWTHPPLGKVIISWGIGLFGMTPFGWRFAGTLFGVLMLPLLFAFAKRIFGKHPNSTFWAGLATFIFAFDFMHFSQTRLATIDTYVVIFIMGMYYYMFKYSQMNFYKDKLSKTLVPLFFSGIFTGLAVASKWQGVYGVMGIAAIFFWVMIRRYIEYYKALKAKYAEEYDIYTHEKAKAKNIPIPDFWKNTVITCAACIGFFIIIPLIIYLLSYIPFYNTGHLYPERGFIAAVWQNQLDMFNYHANLVAEHPFSSTWFQWIVNYRPIWYFSNRSFPYDISQGISSFGNPLIWWGGIVALLYCIYLAIRRKDKIAIFLLIAYISQILPWVFVPRLAFIYHYFPNVPFIVLMLVYMLKNTRLLGTKLVAKIFGNRKIAALTFAIACFALFVLFYPVLSGIPISRGFVDLYLRWLPSWSLI